MEGQEVVHVVPLWSIDANALGTVEDFHAGVVVRIVGVERVVTWRLHCRTSGDTF